MLSHTLHQFHENDLFTSAAAMSYFGLMALFPALLLLLAISNKLAAGSQMLAHAVDVYPGSREFLVKTIEAFASLGFGAIVTCIILVLWAGSWVFAVVERALNRIWGAISRTFWHGRALTIGMVGVVGLLLSFSVLVTSALVALREMQEDSRHDRSRDTVAAVSRQCVLASTLLCGKLSDHRCALCARFIVYCRAQQVTWRDTLPGAFPGRPVVGSREVHFRLEPQLFSLRSDLWIGRRCGRCSDVELCIEFDTAVWRAAHRRLPPRASLLATSRDTMHISDFDYELPADLIAQTPLETARCLANARARSSQTNLV